MERGSSGLEIGVKKKLESEGGLFDVVIFVCRVLLIFLLFAANNS